MDSMTFGARLLAVLSLVASAVLAPGIAVAQMAGHNVIIVHGFQPPDLLRPPSDAEILSRRAFSEYWHGKADAFLNWSSAERVEGTARLLIQQAKDIADRRLCDNGCVLVSVSGGDLVTRYFLQNQAFWMRNAGYEPLKILATLDFAGAGGGTEVADIIVAVTSGEDVPLTIKLAVGALLGLNLDLLDYEQVGTARDLSIAGARSVAMAPNSIPRIRFSASSGLVDPKSPIKLLLRGADDSFIPAHSTCAASAPDPIESCSNNVTYEGKRTAAYGPRGLWYNHFPVLMANNYDHFNIINDEQKGMVTYVLNNFDANGVAVDFLTYTKTVTRNWWELWKETGTWQYVRDSHIKSVSRLVDETFSH